jgi:uncharacterized protein YyaL (SSP411 family)
VKKFLPLLFIFLFSCQSESQMTNRLANSTSPYLLQHAHNPVDWYPWGEEALNKAKEEDKPIIVSIGYSSCHWCHVMAHESFEDSTTAAIMNANFINIKVDREERPDIDQIYMDAVQKMGLNGGWPLNVFLTPDQKPFYGGTYFPKDGWQKLLKNVSDAFRENRTKIDESAEQFAQAIGQSELEKFGLNESEFSFDRPQIDSLLENLGQRFDSKFGGMNKAPKFPMPSIWEMLEIIYARTGNELAEDHLVFTLEQMANGGIYDQVGGGFSRYSVDAEWHVPHFEKMLYDNGQLLSIYAEAYKIAPSPQFKQVMTETAIWLDREMKHKSGGFYAALDADSEGEEGKFYVWTIEEIEEIAGDDARLIKAYYYVQLNGNWEEDKNVLRKLISDEAFAKGFGVSPNELLMAVTKFKKKALSVRDKRIRPGLDSKLIAGWNGLALTGLCKSYQATGDPLFLTLANDNAKFLKTLIKKDQLMRFPSGNMEGFLEDYAAVVQAFLIYYQTTFDETYLHSAQQLTDNVLADFYDEKEGFFYFSSNEAESLIARKKEVFDNVIPSSNSMMARNLFHLGSLTYNDALIDISREMVGKMSKLIPQEPEYLSNWASLAMEMSSDFAEIVIVGPDYQEFANEINARHLPTKVISAAAKESDLPQFEMKSMMNGQTTIYVCYNRACKLPVTSVEKALSQLK